MDICSHAVNACNKQYDNFRWLRSYLSGNELQYNQLRNCMCRSLLHLCMFHHYDMDWKSIRLYLKSIAGCL